jgi:hypothetical protein
MMADETNRAIFLENETTGDIVDTITQATGDAVLYSREFLEDSEATKDRTLLVDCADDDVSTPTIQVKISQKIGQSWTDYEEIEAASVVPKQILVSMFDDSVWRKNYGVKFEFTKVGGGAVTYTNAYWI